MFASNLPIELLRSIVRYLDVKSYLSLTQSCHYFYDLASVQESEKELLIDEDYWENAMRAEIGGDTTLLKLNEGITWEVVVKSLWQDIKLDWFEVISDPSLYRIASFLHTSNAEDIEDIFERASYRRSLRLLMNEDSFLPACEYHETSEELFDTDESKLFEFFSEITSFKFQLPDQNILRFNIGEQVALQCLKCVLTHMVGTLFLNQ